MKKQPLTLRLKNIGRMSLLIGAAISLCILGTLKFGEEYINKLDTHLIKYYVSYYHDHLNAAKVQIENQDSVALFETLLQNLDATQRGDRLASIKESSLDLVTNFYIEKSQFSKALPWAETWNQFDERNLTASVRLYAIQHKIPSLKNDAILGLEVLRQRAPEAELVSMTSVRWALEEHRHWDALNAAKIYFERTYNSYDFPWLIYWDTGTGFKDAQSLRVYPSIRLLKELRLEANLPSDIVRLRFDPPPLSRFLIKEPVWGWGQEELAVMSVLSEKLGMNDIKQNLNSLEAKGGPDPYFFWEVPKHYSDSGRLTHFNASLEKSFPQWFGEIITHFEKAHEENGIVTPSDPELTGFYLNLKRQLQGQQRTKANFSVKRPETRISVYWSNNEKHFSEERTLRKKVVLEKNGGFKSAYPIGETVRKIRFDFPASSKAKVKITRIGVIRDGVEEPIDLTKAKYLLMNNMSREGLDFSLEGKDPHFAIALKEGVIESIYFNGEIH